MKKKQIALFFCLVIARNGYSQDKYWITFRDKAGTVFNPYEYFDVRTIEQRIKQNISLNQATDFPVNDEYIALVKSIVDSVSYSSRWLNGIAAFASEIEIEKVSALACVSAIEPMIRNAETTLIKEKKKEIKNKTALLKYQTDRLEGNKFRDKQLDGSGIRIALFDAGFPGVDNHPAFAKLRQNKKIIATHDFVKKKEFVYGYNSHGTMTLSCLGGMNDSIHCGLATGAEFLLARTEMAIREPFSEEENWLVAVEWADQHGANIISSSLGYTNERYFNTDMNGKKSLVARAAGIAASKGLLVVNAAGNEGNDSWRFVDTPGDADSVLTVGGTDPLTDSHIFFSSFGPTSDGRLKPNVSSPARVIVANASDWSEVEGTSFSTPLVAGFAACVWQSHRDWNNMQVFAEIEKSSHLYPYFDYAHGYGIPQAGYFTEGKKNIDPTFDFVIVNNDLKIILREKYSNTSTEEFLGYNVQRNLYYRIDDSNGIVRYYATVLAEQKEVLYYLINQFRPGDKLTVHFEGYTNSYTITGNENPAEEK